MHACCAATARAPAVVAGPKPRARPARRLARTSVCPQAFREHSSAGNGGSASKLGASEALHATKMVNLTLEYFSELMTNGNTDACDKILSPWVEHRDMVRNEGRYGVSEYERYIRELKATYPSIYVKPTSFGYVDDTSLFVAFEGRATEHTPVFKGVDLFCFNEGATKITAVEVYRSNWLGAQGHEDRKLAAAGKPRLAT